METKSFATSKLNWLGIILVVAGVLSDPQYSSLVSGFVPVEYLPKVMSAAGLLVVVLRTFFTSTTVTVGKPKDQITGLLAAIILPALFGILCVVFSGCATMATKPDATPVDCTGSMYAKIGGRNVDTALTLAVASVHMAAFCDQGRYATIQGAAKAMASILRNENMAVSIASLTGIKGADMLIAVFTTLYPPNQLLHQCDRNVLVKYLDMI